MRKWTYLVAALLMGGVTTSLTSCIDNEEPAGITDLRGAKAELLRAKAEVEKAEAQKRLADAAYTNALAAIKQEKANQEALRTELMAAKNEQRKQEIQQEMALSAEKYKADLFAAQEVAAQAELAYKQALEDIEIQMIMNSKEDKYAAALVEFLQTQDFTYTIPEIAITKNEETGEVVYDEKTGLVKYEIKEKKVTVKGYYSLLTRTSQAKHELSKINTDLLNLTSTVDPLDLKKQNEAFIAYYDGLIKADEKLLAEYKELQDGSLKDWETQYDELEQKISDVVKAIDEKATKLAEDILPIDNQIKELNAAYGVRNEVKFSFDSKLSPKIESYLYNVIYRVFDDKRIDELVNEIISQSGKDENGATLFSDGLVLSLSSEELQTLLHAEFYPGGPTLLSYVQSIADKGSANNIAQTQQEIKVKEINAENAKVAYEKEYAIWNELMYGKDGKGGGFLDKANAYGYKFKEETATNKYDARNTLIKVIAEYNLLSDKDKEAKAKDYATKIATYLTERYDLDGFNVEYTSATTEKPAVYYKDALKSTDVDVQSAALNSFLSDYDPSNPDAMLGGCTLTEDVSSSLYAKLAASTRKIWGENVYEFSFDRTVYRWITSEISIDVESRLTAVVAEEWEAQDSAVKDYLIDVYLMGSESSTFRSWNYDNSPLTSIVGDGLANDYFASSYDLAQAKDELENKDMWVAFAENLTKIDEENALVMSDYVKSLATLNNQKNSLQYTFEQETAELTRTKEGYEGLETILKMVVSDEIGSNNETVEVETVKNCIQNKIIEIEGGLQDGVYVVGTLATNNANMQYYKNINTLIDEGKYEYETLLDQQISLKKAEQEAKETEIDVLTKLVDQANKKKDILIEGMTGGSSSTTPDVPETPAE